MTKATRNVPFIIRFLLLVGLGFFWSTDASAQQPPAVLAFYYAWFDQSTWSSGQAKDLPVDPYVSADPATIERHVAQAQSAGIDAFVQSWYGPQVENNQTETNFRTLLNVAQAQGFKAAVDFETTSPFLGDVGAVTNALVSLLSTHVQHPAYLRQQGKPVIFFWRQQRFSVDEWVAIRNQVDPNGDSLWIAEGVDLAYQAVFDGHHLYSIAWAVSPAAQLAQWGDRVRSYEAENQVDRLWVATAMPGYDDTGLARADAFVTPRRDGDYYRETWQGAVASQPDMIIITSFNEWLEGTQIEPSASFGNRYLDVTRELVTSLRGSPPPAVPAAQVELSPLAPAENPEAQEEPPAEPYIRTSDLTNVRSGPATSFEVVGRLAAEAAVAVTGRADESEWWQIEFESSPDGTGWVAAEVVEFVGDAAAVPVVVAPAPNQAGETDEPTASILIPTGGVNVRSGPGLDFELMGRLDEAESVPVVAQNDNGDWWQIEYAAAGSGLAWVAAVVVDFSGDREAVPVVPASGSSADPDSSTPRLIEPAITGSVEALDAINVRSEPSLEGAVLGGFYLGETADVLAISEDGEWWQIEYANAPDQPAWVAAEFVVFSGEQSTVPIFGLGTATPTPGPTVTPTVGTTPTPVSTITSEQPTLAPTATSIYEGTSAAILAARGTPEPVPADAAEQDTSSIWGNIPWGILSVLVIAGFLYYQFIQRRRFR
jgi:uncharacterized protein YgiM (DUF1202 family)